MKTLTEKENEALLLIFKDFTTDYNANSLSKVLNITPRGALKVLKNLQSENLLIGKKMGKAVFYKANLEDNYTQSIIQSLLIKQSMENANRWIDEFKKLYPATHIVIIYGSALRNYKEAKDIDILVIRSENNYKSIMKLIEDRGEILPKPIHPIMMLPEELEKNLNNKNPAMVNAIREGCVLHGQAKLIEVIKNVTKL
jgi:predicted nucleotidyltransferase